MASEDDFTIKITGRGGHASAPHTGIDPLASAVEIYQGIQTIISRNVNPQHPAVISVTEFITDGAHNAIPTNVEMRGDARSCSAEDRRLIEMRMRKICESVCEMNGAECSFTYTHAFLPLCNTKECADNAAAAARIVVGDENVNADCEPWMGSEDFAAFLEYVPGCFVFLGSGARDGGEAVPLHNALYDYNDGVLETGAEFWAEHAKGCLRRKSCSPERYRQKNTAEISAVFLSAGLFCSYNFEPVSVGIGYEIKTHFCVLITYAAHFAVVAVSLFIIVNLEAEMKFTLAKVVFLRMIPQPGEFKAEIGKIVSHKYNFKRAVIGAFAACYLETKCILIEFYGFIEVGYVEILMYHFSLHI